MIIAIALELKMSPEEVENMSEYWFSRLVTYLEGRSRADEERSKKRH